MFYVYLKMQLIQTVLVIYTAVYLHIGMSRSEEECWALVYKIATGGNGNAYDLFISNETLNVNDKEAMSFKYSTNQVKKHFKSDIVNNWSNLEIDRVKLSIYMSGIEKAFFLFNGSGTTKSSWFNKSRLIDSSYSDLNKDIELKYFSIFGIEGKSQRQTGKLYMRRFYIRSIDNSQECPTDKGFLLVGDAYGNCEYETKISEKPFILFSESYSVSLAQHHAVADTMAIFVKFKDTCFNQLAMNCVHEDSTCISKSVHISSTNTVLLDDQAQSTVSASKDEAQCTTMRNEDLQNKIDRMKKELTVPKKSTQKYMRSLTSAPDERTSSKLMGMIGGIFIFSVVGFIVLLDCATCNKRRKGKAKKAATK